MPRAHSSKKPAGEGRCRMFLALCFGIQCLPLIHVIRLIISTHCYDQHSLENSDGREKVTGRERRALSHARYDNSPFGFGLLLHCFTFQCIPGSARLSSRAECMIAQPPPPRASSCIHTSYLDAPRSFILFAASSLLHPERALSHRRPSPVRIRND